nr:hypothetical protein HmN_000180800 [Hymenolepis microstoma]
MSSPILLAPQPHSTPSSPPYNQFQHHGTLAYSYFSPPQIPPSHFSLPTCNLFLCIFLLLFLLFHLNILLLLSPPALTRSQGMAFSAPPLTTFTPINSSISSFHTPTHSTLHFSTRSHFIHNSTNPHTLLPFPPPSSPPHPSTPPPLLLTTFCANADADCAASAIARSILVTATPNFNYPPSTLKTIGPTNTTTTTTSSTTSIGTLYSNSIAAQPTLHHEN